MGALLLMIAGLGAGAAGIATGLLSGLPIVGALFAVLTPGARRLIGLAAVAVFVFGFGWVKGDAHASAKCDAAVVRGQLAAANARIEFLNLQISAIRTAAELDQARAEKAETERATYQEKARVLALQISTGQCFPDADSDRVRQLWGHPRARRNKG